LEKNEVHIERLLGRRVHGLNGRSIGRLEEVRAVVSGSSVLVSEFLVGSYALFERLSEISIGRAVLKVIGARRKGGYRIPWDKLDLTNPARPRLLCKVEELESC
jgi:sporulation protein YlmC with PRC-barrel domain